MKQTLQKLIADGKVAQAIQSLLTLTKGTDADLHNEVLQLSARFAEYEKQKRLGIAEEGYLSIERNKINAALLFIIGKLEDVGSTSNFKNLDNMKQEHHGSSDNVAGNKIGRQINMGAGSTYNENNSGSLKENELVKKETETTPKVVQNEPPKLPETPSGFLGQLFGSLPKPINYIVAIGLLSLVAYVGYHYFMPKKEADTKKVEQPQTALPVVKKVFVSGKIFVNNGEPRPNEITRLVLSGLHDVNSARKDGTGKFTFENVVIPANKKLLVEVTFSNGEVLPTEEINVGEVNSENNTVNLPNLYATRPQPAKSGKPATGWKIQVNVNTGSGTLNATQN